MAVNVLALDIEGGHGGSSKSLYTAIVGLDKDKVKVEVWCKRGSDLQEKYAELGVTCKIKPKMPKVSALPKLSRNLYSHLRFSKDFYLASDFRADLVRQINSRFDVVHFNHESLAWLGLWLRSKVSAKLVFHNRTMLRPSIFSRWQVRAMDSAADHLIFITENEQENVSELGAVSPASVIFNPVFVYDHLDDCFEEEQVEESGFRVCCLSNFSWGRGLDRMVEVAQILKKDSQDNITFVVIGDIQLSRKLPGQLGEVARNGGDFSDYARVSGVADMFEFVGHISNPKHLLSKCDVLVKPSRESNPWGRDILEAMALGKPTISIGTYSRFIKNRKTGVLLSQYQPRELADVIVWLSKNPVVAREMGRRAKKLVRETCSVSSAAEQLTEIWGT